MIPQIDRDANAAWTEYQAADQRTRENRNLSPEGKAQEFARNRAAYDAKVEQLRAQGKLQTDSDRRTSQLALKLEHARDIRQLRADVGNDVLAAQIIRDRLEAAPSAEIQAIYEGVADDAWARAIVGNYGRLIVARRAGERSDDADDEAARALAPKRYHGDVEHENRVKDLAPDKVEKWLADLDRGQRAQTFADKFNLRAEYVPLPVPEDAV